MLSTRLENNLISGDTMEKVILNQDLSGLSPTQKLEYVSHLCKSLGLNPLTKPFEILKFQGKEIVYARKDCTEQLRKLHNVSIIKLETISIDGGVYVVTATAQLPNGRLDTSTGSVSITGLKGDALSNALMKCETKAKRRVTLSICGLGMLDESELESMPIEVRHPANISLMVQENKQKLEEDLKEIASTETKEALYQVYTKVYKHWNKDRNAINKIVEAKDDKKKEIELNINISEAAQ